MKDNIEVNNNNDGIGFVGLLTIVFITLKLLKVIQWSWWWVISPIWITSVVIMILVVFPLVLVFIVEKRKDKK